MMPTSVNSTNSAKHIVVRSNSQSCHGGAPRRAGGGEGSRSVRVSVDGVMAGYSAARSVDMINPTKKAAARNRSRPQGFLLEEEERCYCQEEYRLRA